MRYKLLAIASVFVLFVQSAYAGETIRLGYMPNITHAQALVILDKGKNPDITPYSFPSGPAVVDALFTERVDIAYIGPNPAINGYLKSKGKSFVIIAGATSGGAVLVMKKGHKLTDKSRICAPSMGNTQDVALRHYLKEHNLHPEILDVPNREIFQLFKSNKIDGAWVPEPWGAILRKENGEILVDERDLWKNGIFPTAMVVVTKKYLREHKAEVEKYLALHVETTRWIEANPDEAKKSIGNQLYKLTKKKVAEKILNESFSRIAVTYDPMEESLNETARHAYELGFLGYKKYDLSRIYDLTILNEILKSGK